MEQTVAHDPHHDDMPFTPEEIHELHTQDMKAGTYVVGLMLSIFCTGVFLYSIIAVVCSG
ncbi:MAG: hypothetical protein U0793_01150 [Gemmataceae bacterium]